MPNSYWASFLFVTIAMTNNTLQNTLIILFAGVACVLGYLVYSNNLGGVPQPEQNNDGLMKTEAEFRDKLTTLNMDKRKIEQAVKLLETSKKKTVEFLKEKGINSGDDYLKSDNSEIKLAVLNLKKDINAIKKSKQNINTYQDAITRIRSMLDQIKRDRISDSVALTDQQAIDLETIIVDLDERLDVETDIFEDDELKKLLDLEMIDD